MNPESEKERALEVDPDATTVRDNGQVIEGGGDAAADGDAARPGTADVQAYIGRQLRAVYDDVVKQPIPDRFLALMKQLEEQGPNG
ncbi:MAG: NepR family anti-sigma factor [Janthinobacterium lividum]